MSESVFAQFHDKIWAHAWKVTMRATDLTGGFPLNESVIESWVKSKIADNDDLLQAAIAQSMLDSAETKKFTTAEEAAKALAKTKSLKGFKRDANGLYIEGRQVKAAIKEAAMVAAQGGNIEGGQKYGKLSTKKGLFGFVAEHIHVPEARIYLGKQLPDEVRFDFVHLAMSHGFKQSEVVHDAEFSFTVETDYEFPEGFWEALWVTGEMQGIGSDRSQGQGRYAVTKWEKIR